MELVTSFVTCRVTRGWDGEVSQRRPQLCTVRISVHPTVSAFSQDLEASSEEDIGDQVC